MATLFVACVSAIVGSHERIDRGGARQTIALPAHLCVTR
jgi:hypothetical protein